MKKMSKTVFLFLSIALFSIANATEKSNYLFYMLNYNHMFNVDNKELKDAGIGNNDLISHFRISGNKSIIYDNGFAMRWEFNIEFLRLNQKLIEKNNIKKKIFDGDLGLLSLGYSKIKGDFNFGVFAGVGISHETHIIRSNITDFAAFYIPIVIWNEYKMSEYYTFYNTVQYNSKYMMKYKFKSLNEKFADSIKHEIKFDLGLKFESEIIGLFVNYYSMPYANEKRVNTLVYGIGVGISI